MTAIDINCDMGEGMGNDAALMPYISSANIASGYHAGGEAVIRQTIDLALKYGVKIGIHPSFKDREHFGRKELHLSFEDVYTLIIQQLVKTDIIAKETNARIHHVKPHGALYNMAARDPEMARTIANAVKDFHEDLVIYGLSGSYLISEAKALGLQTASEVFADRTYQDDGSLTPRTQPNALIEDPEKAIQQVLQMVNDGSVTTVSGKKIPIVAETICIHGDEKNALIFAKAIHNKLLELQRREDTRV